MSRYDGLIIPRSYSEYINKTDAATLQQALQLSGVLSGAVAAGDNKAVTSNAVNSALANYVMKGSSPTFQEVKINGFLNLNTTHREDYILMSNRVVKVYFLVAWNNTTSCGYLVNKESSNKITLEKLFGNAYVSTNNYNVWFNVEPGTPNPCDYIMF
ncbi:hypothetical protein [uncultured Treponema sp.]|uniref:hypothetical protein n=1 Tax=uncultured Treponema sp. TaxID=162155 RepID=UPI0025F1ED44|nr:hypothetical protein [uncultured Treponema sp.]